MVVPSRWKPGYLVVLSERVAVALGHGPELELLVGYDDSRDGMERVVLMDADFQARPDP